MQMFRKVQLKFMLIPILVSACLLALVFGTIMGLTASIYARSAHIVLANAIDDKKGENAPAGSRESCYCFVAIDSKIVEVSDNMLENLSSLKGGELIRKVMETDKSIVKVDENCYRVMKVDVTIDGHTATKYAILDWTTDKESLNSLGRMLAIVYVLSISLISFLCYIFAKSAVAPIKEAFDKQQELIANASHELKTPLTIITTNLDLVRSDEGATVQSNARWLDSASYQLTRMSSLILQMLELSSLDGANKSFAKDNVALTELCQGILLSFEASCYEKNISIDSSLENNLSYIGDKQELEKAVTILVDNAQKYAGANGKINFTLAKQPKQISIKVKNTGAGIDEKDIANVFERFYKCDSSHAESGNSFGLGLSIAKSIVLRLGGDIFCTSVKNEWTTFEIVLPLSATRIRAHQIATKEQLKIEKK
ncbi:MAG: HAMP domain-containing sensor histidine kinase [Clostridia bacterium]